MEYSDEFKRYFSKVRIFSFKDASRFLKKMGASDAYVKLFMHNQVRKRGLHRIGKGKYTYKDDETVIGFAFNPFYYGLEHALTIHGLWTQMTNPVIVTAAKAVPGVREAMGRKVIVRRISEKMFFGSEQIDYNGSFIPVSDVEKTLIDFIYFRISLNNEDMANLVKATDRQKLRRYSGRCSTRVQKAVARVLREYGKRRTSR